MKYLACAIFQLVCLSFSVFCEESSACRSSKCVSNKPPLNIIIDTDAGSDDAMAIFYMLRAEKYAKEASCTSGPTVKAITAVNGNACLDNVVTNVLKVLTTVNRLDIPLYIGANRSMMSTPPRSNYFGADGLGDFPWKNPPSHDLAQKEHAVNALVRMVNENPGTITLLALGPLTNVAMAIRMDENFVKKLKKLVILGGSVHGRGNILPGVEFNFYMDPIAVYVVVNDAEFLPHQVMLVPLEANTEMNIPMEWRKNVLGALDSVEMDFINKAEHHDEMKEEGVWLFPDVVVSAVVVDDCLIKKMESHGVVAVTEGATKGGIAVDYEDELKSKQKIDIVFDVDTEKFQRALIHHFE